MGIFDSNYRDKAAKTFPNLALATFASRLETLLADSESVLDLACGSNSPLIYIEKKRKTSGVELHKKSLAVSKKKKIHDEYFCEDVCKIDKKFKNNQFDAVIALDIIEHLSKKDGLKMIKDSEKIAKKIVIILTPNGFIEQSDHENNLQEHLSGWNIGEFEKLGYKVEGMYGLSALRGEKAGLKYKPKLFWGVISELSHYLFTKHNPEYSFSLLCYKRLANE